MQEIRFGDLAAPSIPINRLTPGEVDAIERATQLTLGKIRRMGETCVCDHPITAHRHKDAEGAIREDLTACDRDECRCETFAPDLPARFGTALMWISLRRVRPTIKLSEITDSEDALSVVEVDDETPTPALG